MQIHKAIIAALLTLSTACVAEPDPADEIIAGDEPNDHVRDIEIDAQLELAGGRDLGHILEELEAGHEIEHAK